MAETGQDRASGTEPEAPGFDLDAVRADIPLLRTAIPMNACSHAPQTGATREAAEAYLDAWNTRGMDWDAWMAEVAEARAAFAALIGAEPGEVAVTTSVSAATASLASALDYSGRRTIVVSEAEFPTVAHVWLAQRRHGARIAWAPVRDGMIEPEAYDAVIDDDTALVSACRGYYQTGYKQDVAAIAARAHAHGALLYVDAYQTLGSEPLDVHALDVDVLACGALKFLMGVPGIAFIYVRRELVERLRPAVTGWFGRADPFAFDAHSLDWAADATRFETGTPPVLPAYIARAGLELLHRTGPDAVAAWDRVLSRRLVEGGRARGLERLGTGDVARKAPTTAFACPGDSHVVEAALRARGIIASARGPAIRLAPHFYNTLDDVDAALDALADVLKGT